jgi:hypothetical protein
MSIPPILNVFGLAKELRGIASLDARAVMLDPGIAFLALRWAAKDLPAQCRLRALSESIDCANITPMEDLT